MPEINIPLRYDILRHKEKYDRIRVLLENDESEYTNDTFCLTLPNEPPNAKDIRKKLLKVSFKNITHDLLSATKDAIFHEQIRLAFEGGNKNPLFDWCKDVTMGDKNMSLLQYAADVICYGLRGYGHVWTILDKPDYQANSFQDELKSGAPYIANVWPGNVQNYEIQNGELQWFAYNCLYTPQWADPLLPQPTGARPQLRIWTKNNFVVVDDGKATTFTHNFGFVPVVYQSFILPTDEASIIGITPFFTTSNLLIAANNMQSIADMEIYKHGTSVLTMHEESINTLNNEIDGSGGEHTKTQDPTGFNILHWSGVEPPEYLVKDLQAVEKAGDRASYYFGAAIQNERTMQSIFRKRETVRESGETKDYDAEPARAALRATAEDLEEWCKKVLIMVSRMFNKPELTDKLICEFPENFILTKDFNTKLDEIAKMATAKYPSARGWKEKFKSLTPDIAHNQDIREEIDKEIEEAEINVDFDAEVNAALADEADEEKKFEESIKDLEPEEQAKKRAAKKLKVNNV